MSMIVRHKRRRRRRNGCHWQGAERLRELNIQHLHIYIKYLYIDFDFILIMQL